MSHSDIDIGSNSILAQKHCIGLYRTASKLSDVNVCMICADIVSYRYRYRSILKAATLVSYRK
uniref:Rna-directed dna polymerase from mobile element jockey-like protein n=1 Tax=Nothobranchius kadleci TaxID=1051664 RepID=A0A1A8BNV5_NOTKA